MLTDNVLVQAAAVWWFLIKQTCSNLSPKPYKDCEPLTTRHDWQKCF